MLLEATKKHKNDKPQKAQNELLRVRYLPEYLRVVLFLNTRIFRLRVLSIGSRITVAYDGRRED